MRKFNNFGEVLYWAFANLNMCIMARQYGFKEYNKYCFIRREKAFKAYKLGEWKVGNLWVINRSKLIDGSTFCHYCGCEFKDSSEIAFDHILPKSKGGTDSSDNLIAVCKNCNSSKGKKDFLEWFIKTNGYFPPLYLYSLYLKLVYYYSVENDLLSKHKEELEKMDLPFNHKSIQCPLPQPEYFGS